jgi:hypothetical protein
MGLPRKKTGEQTFLTKVRQLAPLLNLVVRILELALKILRIIK